MKKSSWLYVLWGLSILFLSACGNGETPDDSNGDPNDDDPIEEEPYSEVKAEDGHLNMRLAEDDPWQAIMDLSLLKYPDGDIVYEDDMVYLKTNDSTYPLIHGKALKLLDEGYFDNDDVRLRINIDTLEWYDETYESFKLLLNFALIDEAYIIDVSDDQFSEEYTSLGARMPLLETFGLYDGLTRYENYWAGRDNYHEESNLYLPLSGYDFKVEYIDLSSFEQTEGSCYHPEQKCLGGKLEITLTHLGYALFESQEFLDFDQDDIAQVEIEVTDISEGLNVILRWSDEGGTIGTLQTSGTHTFDIDQTGQHRLLFEVIGNEEDQLEIEHIRLLDSLGQEIAFHDARAIDDWPITTGNAEVEKVDIIGLLATFEYDNYKAKLELFDTRIGNQEYDELIEEYEAVCGDKKPHPDYPEDEEKWFFDYPCPVHSITGKGEKTIIGDDEYFLYHVILREYIVQGFEKPPYVLFGTQMHGRVRMADERIEEIIMPSDLKTIPAAAFFEAKRLKTITFPDNLETIEASAFQFAEGFEELVLPKGLTTIEDSAFWGVRNLKQLILPDTLTSIGPYAFAQTEGLTNVELPEDLTSLDRGAFYNSGLESIAIPSNITEISRSVFARNDLQEITIPKNIEVIYTDAFMANHDLKTVIIEAEEVVPILRENYQPGWHDTEYSHAFNATSEDLKIYVPDDLVEAYKEHPSYEAMADRIHSMDTLE